MKTKKIKCCQNKWNFCMSVVPGLCEWNREKYDKDDDDKMLCIRGHRLQKYNLASSTKTFVIEYLSIYYDFHSSDNSKDNTVFYKTVINPTSLFHLLYFLFMCK